MIGEPFPGVDLRVPDLAFQLGACHMVIDAPTDIFGPGLTAVRPPGVLVFQLVDFAKRVQVPHIIEQRIQPCTLFRQEPGVFPVAAPVFQIDVLVGDVPVTADNVGAAAALEFFRCRMKLSMKRNLACWRSSLEEPEGAYRETTDRLSNWYSR